VNNGSNCIVHPAEYDKVTDEKARIPKFVSDHWSLKPFTGERASGKEQRRCKKTIFKNPTNGMPHEMCCSRKYSIEYALRSQEREKKETHGTKIYPEKEATANNE